ncbi:MAG TPA: tetratricopeptide repeat protein [Solirubrobacterales bacterium]|nr:tetratricopeptide repeat protein [Solirubrobacterales bacterium]
MSLASWTGDLQGLTPLIGIVLAALGVWYFRQEIKNVVGRLTKIEATRKDTTVTATMEEEAIDSSVDASGTPEAEDGELGEPEPEAKAISSSADDADDDIEDLRARMIAAYMAGNKEEGDGAYDRLTSLETDPIELRRDQIIQRASGFMGGVDAEGLTALEEWVDDPDLGYLVYRMIGSCHAAGEKPEEAADAYEKSVDLSKDFENKSISASLRAGVLQKVGAHNQAQGELSRMIAEAPEDREAKERLWLALADVYKALGELHLYASSLYRIAQIAGNDASKWFRAGYAYSEAGDANLGILVVHCYKACLSFEPNHQYARNNLGAHLSDRDMPILAAEHYEEAAQLGNTLAMGNMGQLYLNAGFAEDAKRMIDRAEELPETHEKVARVKANIASQRSEQIRQFGAIGDAGSRVGQFLTRYIEARNKAAIELPRQWGRVGGGDVAVEASSTTFSAAWSEGSYRPGRRFDGIRSGAAISGVFEKEGGPLIGKSSWEKDGTGYGLISDASKIEFLRLTEEKAAYVEFAAKIPEDTG